eukprot:15445211-Alexandrium_andersonii.AAC.1
MAWPAARPIATTTARHARGATTARPAAASKCRDGKRHSTHQGAREKERQTQESDRGTQGPP